MLNELEAHVVKCVNEHRLQVYWKPWVREHKHNYMADHGDRSVSIPEIKSTGAYYVALHEIGHFATPALSLTTSSELFELLFNKTSPEHMVAECLATLWAWTQALVWDEDMRSCALEGLTEYYEEAVEGALIIGQDHQLAAPAVQIARKTIKIIIESKDRLPEAG